MEELDINVDETNGGVRAHTHTHLRPKNEAQISG